MQPEKKFGLVKSLLLCFNCLRDGHKSPSCESKNRCLKKDCGKKHHSSLHKYFDDKAVEAKAGTKDGKDGAGKEDSMHVGMLNSSP